MKKVCYLFSGQIRKNSLKDNLSTDTTILDSYKNIFNDRIKEKYDCNIFISTDTINIHIYINRNIIF